MANHGFGGGFPGNDFDALARQYWNAWGEVMRTGAAPAQPQVPGWNEAVAWWSQLAKGVPGTGGSGINDAVDRFNSQASSWFGQMQQLAAQFAGKNAGASDIASAWKQALGGGSANPFADMFKGMQGPGQHGIEQWMEQVAPFLQNMQRDGRSWLGLPAFGFAREHQERWQELAQAQVDYQEKSNAYNALMAEAAQQAFKRFEDKLAERSEPGRQLASARALFDLWIDAAEDAYAEIALSPRFRETYGEYVNAQMRVRAGLQREVEQTSNLLGVPTRTEIDAAHRKIVQLERELRRLRDAMHEREEAAPRAPRAAGAKTAASDVATAAAPRKPAAKQAAAKPAKAKPKAKGAR
jgi:class III poly(R)-hydroxyalkanoic acid synthase PhaE subunit